MRILAPVNNKGGVGKSEVAAMLAIYFSKIKEIPTCLIDMDSQCNSTSRFLNVEFDPAMPEGMMPPIHPDYDPTDPDEDPNWDGRSSIADIFYGGGPIPYPTYIKHLDVIPAHASKLLVAEQVRRSEVVEKIHDRLALFLSCEDVKERYQMVIIDTAPSKGPLTSSVIRAATDIIIPTILEPAPVQGVYGMLQMWMQERTRRKKVNIDQIQLLGILPNFVSNPKTILQKTIEQDLRNNNGIGKYMLPPDIQLVKRTAFPETSSIDSSPRSVFELSDKEPAKKEAIKFCEYIGAKMFSNVTTKEKEHV